MDNGKIPFNIYLDFILIEKIKFYGLTQSALKLLKVIYMKGNNMFK